MRFKKQTILSITTAVLCIGVFFYLTPLVARRPWKEIISKTGLDVFNTASNDTEIRTSSKNINGHSFEMIYQSAKKRLMLLNGGIEPSDKEIEESEKLICYELRISSENQPDILKEFNDRSFEDRIKYFSSTIQHNIKLVIDKDTLNCAMVQMERNFGIAPYLSIQTAFTAVKDWKSMPHHMIINDEYFGYGEIHLEKKLTKSDL